MATSTINTFLMYKSEGSYVKLCDIKDYPDLIGAPEALETTTLSDKAHTYIEGLQSSEQLTFTANYDSASMDSIIALKGEEQDLAVYFDDATEETPTGAEGKFSFKGYVSASIIGKGVNEVREMQIIITPTTDIEKIA